jgi:hypothetical protein
MVEGDAPLLEIFPRGNVTNRIEKVKSYFRRRIDLFSLKNIILPVVLLCSQEF